MMKRTLTVKITVAIDGEDGVSPNPHNLTNRTATVSIDPDLLSVLKWDTIGAHVFDKARQQAQEDRFFYPQ